MREHLMAVDVGTGSARAGVFDLAGRQLARCVVPISVHRPLHNHMEQDSEEIWGAVCAASRAALREAGIAGGTVAAIGFDATCSLVVRTSDGAPLSVSTTDKREHDTILWMDHRALAETSECNGFDDPMLERFGGRLSVEMQLPKLLWLKRHKPETWANAGLIFDLCDYLTWRATGIDRRSHSPLASKWGYAPQPPGARPNEFYARIGLADLIEKAGLPEASHPIRVPVGSLSPTAAEALGLSTECLVAPALVDAYAGAVALFGTDLTHERLPGSRAALIAGTSSCILMLSDEPVSGPGCWGGFRDAALPGLWLTEAGQSASGAFLDHILKDHPAGGTPTKDRHRDILDRITVRLAQEGPDFGLPISVLPDFHGTRSPLSDPLLTGTIAGLDLDRSLDGLLRLYWRSCVALACSIRNIIDRLPSKAGNPQNLFLAGGLADHPLLSQLYADATGRVMHVPDGCDAVLLGSALHAGVCAGVFASTEAGGAAMRFPLRAVHPDPARQKALARDHALLLAMMRHRDELAALR
ncbi:sugar kinase [Rhizobium sp. Root274]|uniref:FGGY family pentulose kinase n=1 Tax=unclassified Rhizobium TaxID=2613769 RepID=UPI000714E7A2|nr:MULTISPECIES: FGGY family pentulose kinase [unclassified Rhizobium]KQW32155.1 sugar kinase [Rhizobium sp. Root1240]KRD33694.1 sugar kinase [Rhizobium sp. Root274]